MADNSNNCEQHSDNVSGTIEVKVSVQTTLPEQNVIAYIIVYGWVFIARNPFIRL